MPGVMLLDSVLNSHKMEKSKVCRCLFGRPDHDKLRKDLDSEMAQMREETMRYMSDKYNFNTEDDEPLEGRYDWQLIKQTDDVPSFYRKGYTNKHRTITRRRLSFNSGLNTPERPSTPVVLPVDGTVCNSSPSAQNGDLQNRLETTPILRDSSFSSESSSPDSDVNDSRPSSRGHLVQTKIEDYLKVRKRRLNLDDDQVRAAKSPRLELW